MKRYGFLYEKICDKSNIETAIWKASKGKRKRKDVKRVINNIDYYISEIHDMLVNETYVPSDYIVGSVNEGTSKKQRDIFKPNFYPDQIIHWAIILQLSPIFEKGMYKFTCGSIPGRGIHYGKKYIERWVEDDRKNTKYFLKMDIKKFYPSVSVELLERSLSMKIKDKKLLSLLHSILIKGKGLPIGILLSQWLANFYLQNLDHYIKQECKAKYYVRYMDDMVIFGPNKKELHKIRIKIELYLKNMKLTLKSNYQVSKLDKEHLDFMGFRFYRNRTTLRRSIMLRITRKIKKIWKKGYANPHDASSIISYLGWIKHSDSYNLFIRWIKPYLKIQVLKNAVRRKETMKYGTRKKRKHSISYGIRYI